MPDTKITALASIGTGTDPAVDPLVIVDVSDTTMAASGTTKKVTLNNLLASSPTATLASATITGDLTVDTNTLKVDSANNRVGFQQATPLHPIHVGTTDLILDSSKNLGLGVTPSAWRSGARAFQSGANGWVSLWEQSSGYVNLSFACYEGAANTYYYKTTGELPAIYKQGAGIHSWWNATSGTAGNTFVPTQAMTLDASGDLSIGGSKFSVSRLTLVSSASYDCFISLQKSGTARTGVVKTDGTNLFISSDSGATGNKVAINLSAPDSSMTLDASGNLLVGDTTPAARIYAHRNDSGNVFGARSTFASFVSTVAFFGADRNTTNNSFYYIDCFNYGSSTYRFRVADSGNATNTNGSYGTISDLRLKENISDARNYLSDLLNLRVVKYSLKSEESAVANKVGFIAQEVEEIFPGLVETSNEDIKSVKTTVLIPMLVKAIQELTARVIALENK